MGLIKDILGSALGSDQINNGFGNKRLSSPFNQKPSPSSGQRPYSSYSGRENSAYYDNRSYSSSGQLQPPPAYSRQPSRQRYNNSYDIDYSSYQQQRQQSPQGFENDNNDYNNYDDYDDYDRDMRFSQGVGRGGFRPLALPQISYGDGQPFLRGYSRVLQQYNISFRDFMQILDAINVAIIPNPENQIFQKGANIAGWFLPGAASIGLMAGQIGVGIGASMGHSSAIAKVLSKANLELFVPNGLEICIGKSKDVDNEVGIASNEGLGPGSRPEDRVAVYGNLVAPLTDILPPLQNSGGRSDPLAMLGQRFSDRSNDKQLRKAQKGLQKGKTKKYDALEGGLQWLMVRQASPSAMDHWQQMLQQSNASMREGQQSRPDRY